MYRYCLLLLLLTSLTYTSFAQITPVYSRAKIYLDKDLTVKGLADLGIEVDHGVYRPSKYFLSEFSTDEIAAIQAAGYAVEIQIEDLTSYIQKVNAGEISIENLEIKSNACTDGSDVLYDYETPANYQLGSMGGYFTYAEILRNLDAMATQYPNLISVKEPIEGIKTHQDRDIFWLRLSDNPTADEDEPEVFYNAVHHAREPNSVAQMIFYMWYLLENYESDPEIQFLVDNTEMYFVPVVNPDGYVYNETTNPNGGGFWRKNRRNNGDGTDGVDLNRNYGYEWGFDNSGSSPNPQSDTYRGTEAFSEPETQAIRDFCNTHEFQIALNYHTFGNLLIYPWGFSDSLTPDAEIFNGFAKAMTRENGYTAGTGSETVGYVVNGDSDDWMYGEQDTKPKIYSMTPEAGPGNFGFWPPRAKIDEINKSALLMNLTTAHLVHNYGLVTETSGTFFNQTTVPVTFQVERYGLKSGDLTVSVTPLSANIAEVTAPQVFNLSPFADSTGVIDLTLSEDIASGETITFLLNIDNGVTVLSDTIRKFFISTETLFTDTADDLLNYEKEGSWDTTTADFVSAPTSITDSPEGNYGTSIRTEIATSRPIALDTSERIFVQYNAKWAIEDDFDYAQIQLSLNGGGTWFTICGAYTEPGTSDQTGGEHVYDGIQNDWVREEIEITEFMVLEDNPQLKVRFILASDNFLEFDGFYFDDLKIITTREDMVNEVYELDENQLTIRTFPNPTSEQLNIEINTTQPITANTQLLIFNAVGQLIDQQSLTTTVDQIATIDVKNYAKGLYFYQVVTPTGTLPALRFIVE
ncbi:MAG: M14 family zinc carboxypeptidase [Saprospiraceae bacterium]